MDIYLEIILLSLAAVMLSVVCIVLIRTIRFRPAAGEHHEVKDFAIDADKAMGDLSEMIRCRTVSSVDPTLEDEGEFLKFKTLLPRIFPNIFRTCDYEEVGERAILIRYKGESSESATVLMAHFDVVEADADKWSHPPFDGYVEDDVLWGRGTLDTKGSLNGILQAAEAAIAEGFVPKNDIYMAFARDEEINGVGASMIVDLFIRRGITPGLVLDEGGAIVENVFPGVNSPCALIGIAEKGMLNLELSYSGGGGHSSSPLPHTPVGLLSRACVNVEGHPFKFRLTDASRRMLDALARHSSFAYRMIFSNLWLFAPVLDFICKKQGGELNALVRTTCAFTRMEGSRGMNVIPTTAKMTANLRLLDGDSVDSATEYVRRCAGVKGVTVEKISGFEPSPVSSCDCPQYRMLEQAIGSTWGGVITSPYLMLACSDSRHWCRISNNVYRFSPMALSKAERETIHGNDERITKSTVVDTVRFYRALIAEC